MLLVPCHIKFWTYPSLHSNWIFIVKTISELVGRPLVPCPLIALFGVLPEEAKMPKLKEDFVTLISRHLLLLFMAYTHTHWVRDPSQLSKIPPVCGRYALITIYRGEGIQNLYVDSTQTHPNFVPADSFILANIQIHQ